MKAAIKFLVIYRHNDKYSVTPELIERIKQMKTEEELIALARENGIDLYATDIRTHCEWMIRTYITGDFF